MDSLTPQQIDAAARILCKNEGQDPDGVFAHSKPGKSRTYFQVHGGRYRDRIKKRWNEMDAIERVVSAAQREQVGTGQP